MVKTGKFTTKCKGDRVIVGSGVSEFWYPQFCPSP